MCVVPNSRATNYGDGIKKQAANCVWLVTFPHVILCEEVYQCSTANGSGHGWLCF